MRPLSATLTWCPASFGVATSIILLLLCGSCSLEAQKQRGRPKEAQVTGEIFIVTKSAENIRLGLVLVSAYPESLILAHLKDRRDAIETLRAPIKIEIASARQRVEAAKSELRSAVHAVNTVPWPESNEELAAFEARQARARDRQRNAEGALGRERAAIELLETRLAAIGSVPYYFTGLRPSPWSAKSDADGRFVLSVPLGRPVVLVAATTRQLLDSTEKYYWMIRISPESLGERKTLPSNDNLALSGSPESVL